MGDGRRSLCAYVLLAALALGFLALSICIGSVSISPAGIWQALKGGGGTEADIILRIRLPRALSALILGGGLALSGYLLQTFFHNPIAGPFLLGISSGAKLMVALAMVCALGQSFALSSWLLVLASFAGAMLSMGFVLLMARLVDRMSILIISGVMIGYICSAVTDLVVTFADDADIVNLHNWSKGSFSGASWPDVRVLAVVMLTAFLCAFLLSKSIGAYQLGESYARSVGVNVRSFRLLMVILSSVLAACVTAFAGPVSFVGVAVPHLVRRLLRTSRPLLLIPACFLGGGVFCLACDLLARTLFAPTELSISTVTAVFGAPVVIIVLVKGKAGKRE